MGRVHRIVSEALRDALGDEKAALAVRGFDIVGDIAIIRVPDALEGDRRLIGYALLQSLSHVKTVLRQLGPVEGDFRTRRLEWLAGEKRTLTIHKEYGCLYEVDLAMAYFSPRLSYERNRIAELCGSSGEEKVLNMFSGVGCFSIIIAKRSSKVHVYSVDLNPEAIKYHVRNVKLNKVRGVVTVLFGDARQIIESLLKGRAQRVLMPLPEKAYECLDAAIAAIHQDGGVIHYYDFAHAHKNEDPVEKTISRIMEKLHSQPRGFSVKYGRVVRTVGPNWYQVVLDIKIA